MNKEKIYYREEDLILAHQIIEEDIDKAISLDEKDKKESREGNREQSKTLPASISWPKWLMDIYFEIDDNKPMLFVNQYKRLQFTSSTGTGFLLNEGDWIIKRNNGHITWMSDEDFKELYKEFNENILTKCDIKGG